MTKLNKNNYVTVEVLEKICRALECDIGDIVSLMPGDARELKWRVWKRDRDQFRAELAKAEQQRRHHTNRSSSLTSKGMPA